MRNPRRAYNADGTVIPPRDLANMQENGVRSVEATLRVLANAPKGGIHASFISRSIS